MGYNLAMQVVQRVAWIVVLINMISIPTCVVIDVHPVIVIHFRCFGLTQPSLKSGTTIFPFSDVSMELLRVYFWMSIEQGMG